MTKRYVVQIIGRYSGTTTQLTFLDFRRRDDAEEWVDRNHGKPHTSYQVVDRGSWWSRLIAKR